MAPVLRLGRDGDLPMGDIVFDNLSEQGDLHVNCWSSAVGLSARCKESRDGYYIVTVLWGFWGGYFVACLLTICIFVF